MSGSVDLVFADPPFNIGYEYDVYEDRKKAHDYLLWSQRWGEQVARVLKPHGTFWLAIGDEFAAELKLLFQKDLGFTCRSWIIWYYTFGVNCTKKFSRSHTHLFHFVRDAKHYTFNGDSIRVQSARQLVYADSRACAKGRLPDDTWILRPQDLPEGFVAEHDTWFFSRVCGTFKERAGWHGCQMPERLLERILSISSNPGDLVLDPFAGSGTTLVVAKKLGRRWIGCELSESYVAKIKARLKAVAEGQPIEGVENPNLSAPPTHKGRKLGAPRSAALVTTKPAGRLEMNRGVLQAFMMVRQGLPADRVIADPELNGQFISTCQGMGLAGEPFEWNCRLLNLRKGGHLKGLPRARRTGISREDVDKYSFACEIAIQHFHKEGCTLDRLLCDPDRAIQFDRAVQTLVGVELPPFLIRWIALSIRKRARDVSRQRETLGHHEPLPKKKDVAAFLDLRQVPCRPGLYWLQSADAEKKLYVGGTLDLRQRLELQLVSSSFGFWNTSRQELEVRFRELGDIDCLPGNQSYWIARWKPEGNYCKLAAL